MHATVVIPAYNAERTIEACLRALASQTAPAGSFETVVVDDGSRDRTAELAETSNARVIRSLHQGRAAARNLGIREAHGDLILFTDADCEPSPEWVETLVGTLDGSPDVSGAKGEYRTRQTESIARWVQLEYEEKYERMRRLPYIDFVDTYSAAYRRAILVEAGGFDETLPVDEDQELSFRLSKQGCRLALEPKAIVYHRHVTTLQAYASRKFGIGYWKARVHRRHPDKLWNDSHTPASLKVEVILLLAACFALLLIPFYRLATAAAVLALVGLFLSSLPLTWFVARRDASLELFAPGLILVRAAALGLGLFVGVWAEMWRSGLVKRLCDVAGACLGLILFSPLMLIIGVAIWLDSGRPVLFTQLRAGKDGRPFRIFKFRSMVRGAEALLDGVIAQSNLPPPVLKVPGDPRTTRVGRFLRRFSLDELPQFLNVLKGDMSLVGPRPEELRIVALYDGWHLRRLSVKPGLTGPMQIDGRADLPLDDRVRVELEYIEHEHLWSDLKILALTLPAILSGKGAY